MDNQPEECGFPDIDDDDDAWLTESIDEVDKSFGDPDDHKHNSDYKSRNDGHLIVVETVETAETSKSSNRNLQVSTGPSSLGFPATPLASMSTPASLSSPRFRFLSDDKTTQELNQLQESAAKRRQDFLESVHGLSCRIAAVTAQLVQERLERDKSLQQMKDTFNVRLEELLDHITLKQDVRGISFADLDRRVTQLDVQMTVTLYKSLYDQVRSKLGSVQERVDASASIRKAFVERSKHDSALFRKVDGLVGDMARRYQEERACRLAGIELAGYQIQEQELDPNSGQKFLDAIQELRKKIALERQERVALDNALKAKIHKETESLKRTLLDLAEADQDEVDEQQRQIVLKF